MSDQLAQFRYTKEWQAVFSHRVEVLMPRKLPDYAALHYFQCAWKSAVEDGMEINAACQKAWENVCFEAMPCAFCGETFASELGQSFCSLHCWNQASGAGCNTDDCDECYNGGNGTSGEDFPEEWRGRYQEAMAAARAAFCDLVKEHADVLG